MTWPVARPALKAILETLDGSIDGEAAVTLAAVHEFSPPNPPQDTPCAVMYSPGKRASWGGGGSEDVVYRVRIRVYIAPGENVQEAQEIADSYGDNLIILMRSHITIDGTVDVIGDVEIGEVSVLEHAGADFIGFEAFIEYTDYNAVTVATGE